MGTSGEARKARGVIGQIQQHSTAMELFRPARARGGLSARLVYSAWLNGVLELLSTCCARLRLPRLSKLSAAWAIGRAGGPGKSPSLYGPTW